MPNITIDNVKDKLMSLDEVRTRLEPTENLNTVEFESATFNFPEDWQVGQSDKNTLAVTPATVTVGGSQWQLTYAAALAAASNIGLQKSYVKKSPGSLVASNLNYWYNNAATKQQKLLTGGSVAVGVLKNTITPFSNLQLLEDTLGAIEDKYGSSDDVMADYKFFHDLDHTNIRLIVPEHTRQMQSKRATEALGDPWSVGIEIRNSVTGKSPLELQGYLFAYICTNGMTSNHASSGKYRRKITETPLDAYEWAASVVEDVLGGLEHELDAVQGLTEVQLAGNLQATIGTMFERFSVPDRQRENILLDFAENGDYSAYGLLASLTQAANGDDVSSQTVGALLDTGGWLLHDLGSLCPTCHKL